MSNRIYGIISISIFYDIILYIWYHMMGSVESAICLQGMEI